MLQSAQKIRSEQQQFAIQPFRSGFVALSDILRAVNAVHKADENGVLAPAAYSDLIASADILFIRTENFRSNNVKGGLSKKEILAVSALSNLVDVLDNAIAEGFRRESSANERGFDRQILATAEDARVKIIGFLDSADQWQDARLRFLTGTIDHQSNKLVWFSLGLLGMGLVSLQVLRAEAIERQCREEAEKRAHFLAYFDPLTELPNRVSFKEKAGDILKDERRCCALVLDLDNFKGINDTLGHSVGDTVLQTIARRIGSRIVAVGGVPSRLSGDEFAAVLPDCSRAQLEKIGAQLVVECSQPIEVDGQSVTAGVSVGGVARDQLAEVDRQNLEAILKVADYALYSAKRSGRGQFRIADDSLMESYVGNRAIIHELPDALRDEKLEVFFQPIIDFARARPRGFEALVRWRRGDQLVSPNAFIDLAERNGLISEIDRFVLHAGISSIVDFNRKHDTEYSLNVNISALALNTDQIVADVRDVLSATELPAERLTLEVTESAVIEKRGSAVGILEQLRELGVRIAIDDFGAGHASLVYVRTLRPNELKIDRALVKDICTSAEARLVFERIVELGLGLGLDVVAEGVEKEEQSLIAREIGCTYGQGFLWGYPEPAEAALEVAAGQVRGIPRGPSELELDLDWERVAKEQIIRRA